MSTSNQQQWDRSLHRCASSAIRKVDSMGMPFSVVISVKMPPNTLGPPMLEPGLLTGWYEEAMPGVTGVVDLKGCKTAFSDSNVRSAKLPATHWPWYSFKPIHSTGGYLLKQFWHGPPLLGIHCSSQSLFDHPQLFKKIIPFVFDDDIRHMISVGELLHAWLVASWPAYRLVQHLPTREARYK
jgi:hypothetical protein